MGVGIRILELENVGDVGAAEPVDRLGIVADHHQVAVLPGEQLEPAVLGVVGVLVLVDEDVAETGGVALADLGEELQDVDGADEEVVEVHRVHAVQLALVGAVDVGDGLLEEGADHLGVGVGVAQLVLGVGDLGVDRAGREALGVDAQVVEAALDQPARVGGVVDRELAGVAQPGGLGAEHARAGGVEGHHPHRAHAAAHQQLGAVAHLPRRLVGERDGQDLVGLGGVGGHQVGDAVGEHARLARARAGEDELRPGPVGDGLPLGLVEAAEQGLEVARELGHRVCRLTLAGGPAGARGRRLRRPPSSCGRGRAPPGLRRGGRPGTQRHGHDRGDPRLRGRARAGRAGAAPARPGRAARPHGADRPPRPTRETRAAYWLTLDAINFGSGWFPTLRKRDGLSGYNTIAAGLARPVSTTTAAGPPPSSPSSTPPRSARSSARTPTTS